MAIIRAIVGMLVAAALGVAAIHYIESAMAAEFGWLGLLLGVFTGIGARLAAGAAANLSYLRGALAALVCLGAFIVGPHVVAKVMTRDVKSSVPVKPAATADDAADAAGDAATPAADPEPVETIAPAVPGTTTGPIPTTSVAGKSSPLDIAYMIGAAALAYFIGRSGKSAAATGAAASAAPATEPESSEPQDAGDAQ